MLFNKFDKLGWNFDGNGDDIVENYDEATISHPFDSHKIALITNELPFYNAHTSAFFYATIVSDKEKHIIII